MKTTLDKAKVMNLIAKYEPVLEEMAYDFNMLMPILDPELDTKEQVPVCFLQILYALSGVSIRFECFDEDFDMATQEWSEEDV